MVRGDDHSAVFCQAGLLEKIQQPPELCVYMGNRFVIFHAQPRQGGRSDVLREETRRFGGRLVVILKSVNKLFARAVGVVGWKEVQIGAEGGRRVLQGFNGPIHDGFEQKTDVIRVQDGQAARITHAIFAHSLALAQQNGDLPQQGKIKRTVWLHLGENKVLSAAVAQQTIIGQQVVIESLVHQAERACPQALLQVLFALDHQNICQDVLGKGQALGCISQLVEQVLPDQRLGLDQPARLVGAVRPGIRAGQQRSRAGSGVVSRAVVGMIDQGVLGKAGQIGGGLPGIPVQRHIAGGQGVEQHQDDIGLGEISALAGILLETGVCCFREASERGCPEPVCQRGQRGQRSQLQEFPSADAGRIFITRHNCSLRCAWGFPKTGCARRQRCCR